MDTQKGNEKLVFSSKLRYFFPVPLGKWYYDWSTVISKTCRRYVVCDRNVRRCYTSMAHVNINSFLILICNVSARRASKKTFLLLYSLLSFSHSCAGVWRSGRYCWCKSRGVIMSLNWWHNFNFSSEMMVRFSASLPYNCSSVICLWAPAVCWFHMSLSLCVEWIEMFYNYVEDNINEWLTNVWNLQKKKKTIFPAFIPLTDNNHALVCVGLSRDNSF